MQSLTIIVLIVPAALSFYALKLLWTAPPALQPARATSSWRWLVCEGILVGAWIALEHHSFAAAFIGVLLILGPLPLLWSAAIAQTWFRAVRKTSPSARQVGTAWLHALTALAVVLGGGHALRLPPVADSMAQFKSSRPEFETLRAMALEDQLRFVDVERPAQGDWGDKLSPARLASYRAAMRRAGILEIRGPTANDEVGLRNGAVEFVLARREFPLKGSQLGGILWLAKSVSAPMPDEANDCGLSVTPLSEPWFAYRSFPCDSSQLSRRQLLNAYGGDAGT